MYVKRNIEARSCATNVAVEEHQVILQNRIVCFSSLRYRACNAHAPYCKLWPAPRWNIFPNYLI